MKNDLLKKFLCTISLASTITLILTTNSNAYESTQEEEQESEYVSMTTIDLSTNEETTFQVSSQDMEIVLEEYNAPSVENTPSINPCAIVGTSDDRTLITNTEAYPYSAIGHLKIIEADNQIKHGTAFLVAPNIAVTAAHCLYDEYGVRVRRLEFSPARNGETYPFGTSSTIVIGSTITVPSDYLTNPNAGNDWALIRFINNVDEDCGWLNLQVGGVNVGPTGETFYVSGYPVHNPEDPRYLPFRTNFLDSMPSGYPFRASGMILSAKTKYLEHEIDTLPGESGSPLYFYNENNQVRVVGIHNESGEYILDENGYRRYSNNYAARVTYTIVNAIAAITQ